MPGLYLRNGQCQYLVQAVETRHSSNTGGSSGSGSDGREVITGDGDNTASPIDWLVQVYDENPLWFWIGATVVGRAAGMLRSSAPEARPANRQH